MFGVDDAVAAGLKVLDKFIPDPEAKAKAESELRDSLMRWDGQQAAINQAEAGNENVFVSGWRPAVGWIGAAALAYQFLFYPLLGWGWKWLQAMSYVPAEMSPPPLLDAEQLWVMLSGILGIAGMRTFEKQKGVASK